MADEYEITEEEKAAADSKTEALKDYVPEGYKTKDEYLCDVRETYSRDIEYDRWNREAAIDDLKFIGMDQWDPLVRQAREAQGRPCLSINVLPQFIGQVIGDRRINKTQIKVVPKKDASVEEARVRSGLIKSIENYSRAERIYDNCCEDQVTCGISNFRVVMDYASDDVFDQDIRLKFIPNPLAVVWDMMSIDPTGRDAEHCFVDDVMPRKIYERRFPNNPSPSTLGDGIAEQEYFQWFTKDITRLSEHWRMISRDRLLVLCASGKIYDITETKQPPEGEQVLKQRWSPKKYAQMHLVTGNDILEGPYELPVSRLPIIKVEGRVARVAEDRVRYGLIRFAKDAQRLKNYWRSTSAETLAMAPKAQWIAPDDAVKGREASFRDANNSGDPLLVYNSGASVPPQRVDPPQINAAVLNESQLCQQDIKDTTGLHDASLGVRSNEISGKAILARQREGDVATIIYHDNLNSSIQEAGDVVNQLLGYCYDTMRTLRTIDQSDQQQMVTFNDPNNPESVDLSKGKYDVEIITGPSYTTQRQESAEAMLETIKVAPQLMTVAGDLIVEAQDWPGAQRIAERIKTTMPPEVTGEDKPLTPEQQAAQAQAQQMQQMQAEAMAVTVQAQVTKETADAEKAQHDAERAKWDAEAARFKAQQAEFEASIGAPAKLLGAEEQRAADNEFRQNNSREQNAVKERLGAAQIESRERTGAAQAAARAQNDRRQGKKKGNGSANR